MDIIIVACPVLLHTALVSLLFGTVIPTSFNILVEMFLLPCIIESVDSIRRDGADTPISPIQK